MIDISQIFDSIATTFAVNATIELYGAVMIFYAAATAISMRLEKGLLRIILLAYVANFLALSGDAVACIFHGVKGETALLATAIGNFVGMTGLIFSGYFYVSVLFYNYKNRDIKTYKVFRTIASCFVVLMMAAFVVSQFTGWLYSIDEGNVYARGSMFYLSGIYAVGILLCALLYMLPRFKRISAQDKKTTVLYIAIPVVGLVLQTVFYGFVFIQIAILVVMETVLLRSLKDHTNRIIEQNKELAEKEIAISKMREQLLLSQVRPHFVYNSLTAMQRIEGNPPETIKAIDDFAKYLRQNLSVAEGIITVPFDVEIEHVNSYVAIEKLRFGDELKVEFDIRNNAFQVPVLSIQVLVENAIKHGVMNKVGGGTVKVSSYKDGLYHVVKVEDDGVGFDVNKPVGSGHIGIKSTKDRLEYYVSGDLKIESEEGKGTIATVTIPVRR